MVENRFKSIYIYIYKLYIYISISICLSVRFDDHETQEERFHRDQDKLGPIREVWDIWVTNVQKMWVPRSEVCVDEMLISIVLLVFYLTVTIDSYQLS